MITPINKIKVFLHRSQDWCKKSILVTLDELYIHGVRAVEIDVMCNDQIHFGHPSRPDKWFKESSDGLSHWATKRGVTVLLDLKQSGWDPSSPVVSKFFEMISPTHFMVASYDLETVVSISQRFGIRACKITSEAPAYMPDNVNFIMPISVAKQMRAEHRKQVIVSGIQSEVEIRSLVNAGLSCFITNELEIATIL